MGEDRWTKKAWDCKSKWQRGRTIGPWKEKSEARECTTIPKL